MTENRCFACGAPENWRELIYRASWEHQAVQTGWSRYSQFNAGTVNSAVANGATYERRKPVRPAKVESDVTVPLLQSIITGITGGIVTGSVAVLVGQGWQSLLYGVAGSGVVFGLAWSVILGEHRRALWEIERIIGRDLDGDDQIGQPIIQREPVRVESIERNVRGGAKRIRYVTLPVGVNDADLERLAEAVLSDDKPFSRRGVAGVIGPDKFAGISRAFQSGGLAQFTNGKNASNGIELTPSGRAFLRQYLPK